MRFPSLPLVATLLLAPTITSANPVIDNTPYTLDTGDVRVGLRSIDVGLGGHPLLERIDVGTYPLAWLALAGGADTYNVHGKFEFWRDETLSLSIGAGVLSVDLEPLDVPAEFFIVPIEGWAGVRATDRLTVIGGVVYTDVELTAGDEVGPIDELRGAVGTSSMQLHAALRYRLSTRTELVLDGRYVAYQRQRAQAMVEEGNVDNTTTYEDDLLDLGHAFAVGLSAHWSWERFNLRLGAEYGNMNIPGVNFVVPERLPTPRFDFYWVF